MILSDLIKSAAVGLDPALASIPFSVHFNGSCAYNLSNSVLSASRVLDFGSAETTTGMSIRPGSHKTDEHTECHVFKDVGFNGDVRKIHALEHA